MMDPWVITPQERERHMQQFNSVNPEAGYITGVQAKGFFMQSGLPPMVLAQIWGLSDMNGDGRMDMNEFSVACKLINLKLKGIEIPKSLPPQMFGGPPTQLSLPSTHRPMQPGMMGMGGMMQQQRMSGMMPGMGGMHGMMPNTSMAGMMPGMMPNTSMGGMMPGMMHNNSMMMPNNSMAGGMSGMMPINSMAGGMPGMMPNNSMMGMNMVGGMGHGMGMNMGPNNSMGLMMGNQGMMGMQQQPAIPGVQPSVLPVQSVVHPAPMAAPAMVEWAVPQQKRVAFTAQFQVNDKARTGYLAAVQARNLLLQTGLAQQTLATVWNLADVDKDGKLSCEEFILAMHLCDLGLKGEPLPQTLPFNLIPPSMRKNLPAGVSQVSTPGSVKSGAVEEVLSPASFEDKRRENWESGQAELQKRRASLMDQQKRDEEARKKKEKEEAEQREKLKKEMEKQRMEEWEKQRRTELEQHRQRETEKVLQLRAQRETMKNELETLKTKMTELTESITETRTGVTEVKAFIDGMRTSRDTKMAELNAVKNQLKDQNQRLMQVTHEKAKLESKNKVNQKRLEEGKVLEITDFDLKKEEKQIKVEGMRKQLEVIQEEEGKKKAEVESNKKMLLEHRERLKKMIETCKALHEGFDEKRREVRAEKQKKIRELTDPNHAWGGGFDKTPAAAVEVEFEPEVVAAATVVTSTHAGGGPVAMGGLASGYLQYRALYDYEARNEDELSFSVDDVILVHPEQEHEPGWLGGELNGKIGWFPEAYAQRIGEAEQTLQPIAEVSETGSENGSLQDRSLGFGEAGGAGEPVGLEQTAVAEAASSEAGLEQGSAEYEQYISIFPYQSEEQDDLQFEAGERILVSRKDGDWWTGTIGDRTGVFPFNYVEPAPQDGFDQSVSSVVDQSVSSVVDQSVSSVVDQSSLADLSTVSTEDNEVSQLTDSDDKSGKKMEIAKVIAPYEATSKEQLSLQMGQMVIVRKKTETGWWQGELQAGGKGKKRAVGWFPASYVKLLDAGPTDKKPEESTQGPGEPYIAMFDYTSQYEDELSFKTGDRILVTNQEEADWWRGTVGDKSGVFPSNYVEPAKSGEVSKRESLVAEIFATEEKYLENVKLVFEIFIKPIRSSNLLTKQEIATLFINWRELIIASTKLVKSMRIRKSTGSQFLIGDILCENFPAMTAYIRFCSSQQNSGVLLQRLVETNPEFNALLKQCQQHYKNEGMLLSYYLLKPVKRVTEYPLLVEKLLKNTGPEHPDYHCTKEALLRARALCEQVNEGMREKENSERLEWLQTHVDLDQEERRQVQEQITFNSLTNSVGPRRFLHCGVLRKTKSDKQLIGFLFNDFFLLTTGSRTLGGSQFSFMKHSDISLKLYRQPMFLSGLELEAAGPSTQKRASVSVDQEPSSGFSLKYADLVLSLEALTANDRTLWYNKMTEAINSFIQVEKEFIDKQKSVREVELSGAQGRLLLIITKAENLSSSKEGGNLHPYCEATIGFQEQKSPVGNGTSPHWNTSMQFLLRDVVEEILCLTVYDRDFFAPNEFLGRTELKIADIVGECRQKMGPITRSLKLLEADSGLLTIKLDIQLFQ